MFIPPAHHHHGHSTVVNNIVYSDTVLPLKDLGTDIKVTTISNVSESSLENCLKIIFESNPNVVFNTVQYSKNNNKVYFYTNKVITTQTYEENKYTNYKPITTNQKILEEVKDILNSENNKDNNCISLYEVSLLLKKLNNDYEMMKLSYESRCESIIKSTFSDNSAFVIYDFDYKNKLLRIGFASCYLHDDYGDIHFAKTNNDLYIAKSKCDHAEEVFTVLSSDLSKLYDEFMTFADYNDDDKSNFYIKPVNSRFCVEVSRFGVEIYVNSRTNLYQRDFKLFSSSYGEYSIKCNSSIVNDAFKNNEDEIFKRIFIKIDDCPEWTKSTLYEIRQKQLAEEKKKEKRLEFKRKLFPFLKK